MNNPFIPPTDGLSAGDVSPSRSLDQWLTYLESIHPHNIELGLDRVVQVFTRLQLSFEHSQVITVAGTNGKGTTCRMLEHAANLAGYSAGVYCSPHLLDYRERVRLNGQMLSAQAHCDAFARVEQARGDISLTYFEFGTLAGLCLLNDAQPDYVLLEVGLGGRLDAVNVVDPGLAVITSIDLDHQDWLGDTRELVATEKAGIFRKGIKAVVGEPDPPTTLIQAVDNNQLQCLWQGKSFQYTDKGDSWDWQLGDKQYLQLPIPNIPMQNASSALAVISILELALSETQLHKLMTQTHMPGRAQVIATEPLVMLDVAHNPEAARLLTKLINRQQYKNIYLVCAMLADKDIQSTLAPFKGLQAQWLLASLSGSRGASSTKLKSVLEPQDLVLEFGTVKDAYQHALAVADKQDLIVIFGSFYTVAEVLESL